MSEGESLADAAHGGEFLAGEAVDAIELLGRCVTNRADDDAYLPLRIQTALSVAADKQRLIHRQSEMLASLSPLWRRVCGKAITLGSVEAASAHEACFALLSKWLELASVLLPLRVFNCDTGWLDDDPPPTVIGADAAKAFRDAARRENLVIGRAVVEVLVSSVQAETQGTLAILAGASWPVGGAEVARVAERTTQSDQAGEPAAEFATEAERAFMTLVSMYSRGASNERVREAARVVVSKALSADEKLKGIDRILSIPRDASGEVLGKVLGVSKTAVLKTDWWGQNRAKDSEERAMRRQDKLQERGLD